MEKMRVPGKTDLKGSQTKTDSTKAFSATEAMQRESFQWGSTRKTSTSTKLDEAHFKDALNRMKESGVRLKGKENESSVDRIIKTITEDVSSEGSLSDLNASSNDTDESDPEIAEKEKLAAQKLLKQLQQKMENPLRPMDISELRKPYLSWLERKNSSLKSGGYTTMDGAARKKMHKKLNKKMEILSDQSEPSQGSPDTSEVETDPEDPFSQSQEGKDIMRKMKKIKTKKEDNRRNPDEDELKRKMEELSTQGPGLRPYLDAINPADRGHSDWSTLAKAQAESRAQRRWTGEVKDIDALWLRDICEASERERKANGGKWHPL